MVSLAKSVHTTISDRPQRNYLLFDYPALCVFMILGENPQGITIEVSLTSTRPAALSHLTNPLTLRWQCQLFNVQVKWHAFRSHIKQPGASWRKSYHHG